MDRSIKPLTLYFCGSEKCLPGHFFGPAVRSHYLIHFILRGKGIYKVGNQFFELKEGEAFLIKPQEITFYQADEKEPWEYTWIAFDGEEANRLLEEANFIGDNYICKLDNEHSYKIYLERFLEIYNKSSYNELQLLGYFYLVFSTIQKNETDLDKVFTHEYLKKAIRYIKDNYGYNIHISDISRHVGIDRTYLYKIFMSYENISPKQYLTKYRILMAKNILANTKHTITEIALSCGFHDSSVFCKNFQMIEHISPLQYRKKHQRI